MEVEGPGCTGVCGGVITYHPYLLDHDDASGDHTPPRSRPRAGVLSQRPGVGVVVCSCPPNYAHQETGLPQVYVAERTFADAAGIAWTAEPELVVYLIKGA